MKAQLVPNRSHLVGKRCRAGCRNRIAAGQSVLVTKMDVRAGDPWVVMHVDCVRAKCETAPEGLPPSNAAAQMEQWRRELAANGGRRVRR